MSRDALSDKMKSIGIYGRRYFYPLISTFSAYRRLESAGRDNLPIAYKMAGEVLCLPIHYDLEENDVQRVLSCLLK